jgi:glycopeptide antibiotics resistance protein
MKKRLLSIFIFLAYIVTLIKVMVFKDIPTIRIGQLMLNFGGTTYDTHPANFVPFTTIVPYLLGDKGWIIAGINLVGNIIPLVPLGFLLPFLYRNMTWKKTLALGVVVGLTIETIQTILHVGIFDIDDVILNTLGVMIGYWSFLILAKWVRERNFINILIATILMIAVGAGAVYAIYPHGQPVVNPQVGAGGQNIQEGNVPKYGDLCGGTGGTGEITSKGDDTITIKSKAGKVQTLTLTPQTDIRNSTGPISASDLKIGDHVTVVVVDDKGTTTTVLVCSL